MRTIQVIDVPQHVRDLFPHVQQVFLVERQITEADQTTYQAVLYITSLTAEHASPADLLAWSDLVPPDCGTYRVLYEIDDEQRVVTVTAVEHRGDVYQSR